MRRALGLIVDPGSEHPGKRADSLRFLVEVGPGGWRLKNEPAGRRDRGQRDDQRAKQGQKRRARWLERVQQAADAQAEGTHRSPDLAPEALAVDAIRHLGLASGGQD